MCVCLLAVAAAGGRRLVTQLLLHSPRQRGEAPTAELQQGCLPAYPGLLLLLFLLLLLTTPPAPPAC